MKIDFPIFEVVTFFELPIWDALENLFTCIGVFSVLWAGVQFIHNTRLKTWKSNFSITDFPGDYDVEQNELNAIYTKLWSEEDDYLSTIVFKPVDCVIPKMKVIELNEEGKKKRNLETFRNLTPEDSVCFRLERCECIPKYKIRWYADYGEYCEHYFHENLRNGITEVAGAVYYATPLSVIRKILGLK